MDRAYFLTTKKSEQMKQVVSEEQAREEIAGWLEFRKVSDKQREQNEDSEQTLIEAVMDGSLTINEDKTMRYRLAWPLGDGSGVSELTFRARMTVGDKATATKGFSPKDGDGRLLGYIAFLTDQPVGVIRKMESGKDHNIATSVAVYFL